jgi:hypothetical protein
MAGYQKHVSELYNKFETPIHVVLYILLFVIIIYVKDIPSQYKYYGNSVLLRIVLFGLILAITQYISFVHGMLFAMFVVLYISFTPGIKGSEAFEDLRIVAKKEQRWYDEQVLGEDPEFMETEKVKTEAIQGS